MLGFDLHWWETAMLLSLFFAAIAAAAVGFATFAVVTLQRVEVKEASARIAEAKESAAQANKRAAEATEGAAEANDRAAQATARAEEAQAGTATANAIAAHANERAASLERETAQAHLEQERLKVQIAELEKGTADAKLKAEEERLARVKIEEKLAPRSMTDAQMVGTTRRLRPHAGVHIDILQVGESPEIDRFRAQLEFAIRAAGLQVVVATTVGSGAQVGLGVGLVEGATKPDIDAANAIHAALTAEEIPIQKVGIAPRANWPGFTMGNPKDTPNTAFVRLYVGSKP